jgi:homoserine dehydrogenase
MVGEVMFYGPGAGKLPTASAVCADIVDAIAHADGSIKLPEFKIAEASDIADINSYACKRFFVFEKCPECALDAKTAEKCFGPISNFAIYGDKVSLITGEMTEKDAATLCAKLNGCKAYRLL